MRYCNCLVYALWRRFTTGEGSIRCRIVKGKLRCWYVLPDGSTERWEPLIYKRGWAAWKDCGWFEGRVRRGARS
jgi:hypothetical protein